MSGKPLLLDSNFLINLFNGRIDANSIPSDRSVYISSITFMEILGFPFNSKDEEQLVRDVLNRFITVYVNKVIAERVIRLRRQRKIKLPDAIICATAVELGAILYSDDKQLKSVDGLEVHSFL